MRTGAILLVGGGSIRMGRSKASLDWHGEPLAARVARVLARAVGDGQVVAVRGPSQDVPDLPAHVEVVADPLEGDGPLRGLAAGLAALQERADVAFVSAVDVPFLDAPFVAAVLGAVGPDDDAVAPVAHGRRHPLAAAYRVALLPVCEELLAAGERRPNVLLDRVRTRLLDEAGPEPAALRNVNTPEEYDEACGREAPRVTVEAPGGPVEVRAWHLQEAVGDLDVGVTVNGARIVSDPWFPLSSGDHISLR